MEQTLHIIEIAISIGLIILAGTLFWQIKSDNRRICQITQIGITTVLFGLQISKLVMKIYLNQPYAIAILLLCLFAFSITLQAYLIGIREGQRAAYLEVSIKIMSGIEAEIGNENRIEGSDNQ
jgi:hypothetical protein